MVNPKYKTSIAVLSFCLIPCVLHALKYKRFVKVEDNFWGGIDRDGKIVALFAPMKGEGWKHFVNRISKGKCSWKRVAKGRKLLLGKRYKFDFFCLSPVNKMLLLDSIFPQDRLESDGWVHTVNFKKGFVYDIGDLSLWLTGDFSNTRVIVEFNKKGDESLIEGEKIVVPAEILLQDLRIFLPRKTDVLLEYPPDKDYAIYRLRPGEALYSAVVVRFTGRVFAEDVNKLAYTFARLSGITDVTDIPKWYPIRIPFEYLLPQYLPEDHPSRVMYERQKARVVKKKNRFSVSYAVVVIDPGHGGLDIGANRGKIWESVYVYDIAVRLKNILERNKLIKVFITTNDPKYKLVNKNWLDLSKKHFVKTSPPYFIKDSKIGVHLRWMLANYISRKEEKNGIDRSHHLFLSIHADSLHPSLRGAMIYVPSARLSKGRVRLTSKVYKRRKEYSRVSFTNFSLRERIKSQNLSYTFGKILLNNFRKRSLPIHSYNPIRTKIIRGRSVYVPAILRFNIIPTKVLLEIVNLSNSKDRKLITSYLFRQRVADAIADSVEEFLLFSSPKIAEVYYDR